MVVALGKVSDDVYDDWLRWLAASGMAVTHAATPRQRAAAPDDNHGMGGHLGPQPWHAMTDQAQCDQLESELALARDTALKYPTVADAKAAGWRAGHAVRARHRRPLHELPARRRQVRDRPSPR